MYILNRRNFIRRATLGAAGVLAGSMMNVPRPLRQAWADGAGFTYNGKKLMFIFLRGGNDGLNTIVPGGDPAYYSNRPGINIPLPSAALTDCGMADTTPEPGRGIDLGNGFAMLHPELHDLVPIYNTGELALLHRVGYADQSRSHFNSQHYWETGVPGDQNLEEGIFYRTLVELGLHESQALPGVSFSSNL
ncbi:MAG: twin-arginine translocation signal domain-containing protein, partial [Verrucomicrobiota bacterium]